MEYAVLWVPTGERMVRDVISISPTPEDEADAAYELELNLREDPFDTGESRERRSKRFAFRPQLGISFVIDDSSHTVYVFAAWLIR